MTAALPFARFAALPADAVPGFVESWRYTNLSAADAIDWVPAIEEPQAIDRLPDALVADAARLVLVNGTPRFDLTPLSLPAGVTLAGFDGTMPGEGLIHLLSDALGDGGIAISVAPGVVVEQPIELDWLALAAGRPLAMAPRLSVHLGRGSALTLIETRRGFGRTLDARVMEATLDANAQLTHLVWQDADLESTSLSAGTVRLARDARLHHVTLTTGAALSRSEMRAILAEPGAEATVNNAWLLRGRQHADTVVRIDHDAPHGASHQLAKGVLDDATRGVFQGRIGVAKGAQKTDGYQMSRSLLLSDKAEADSKPELEIFADDVKCSHGSTIGRLDEGSLFYLQSRGIPRAEAESLLVRAFVEEVIDTIPASAREAFRMRAHDWLGSRTP